MIRIGITGQSGFVGTHLFHALSKQTEKFECVPFEDYFFEDEIKLRSFVKKCDIIVHLAAMMRNPVEGVVYNTNMHLVQQVIDACDSEHVEPCIMFASSIQENNGSEYGRCKQEGRKMLMQWAEEHNTGFGGMIFPNLFGASAKPNSHSFVATFCYKLIHGEEPQILVDNQISLKYIDTLLSEIIPMMEDVYEKKCIINKEIKYDYQIKVSEVLTILLRFKETYLDRKEMPELNSQVERDLFETFLSYR